MNNLKSYTEYAVTTPTTDFVIGFDFNYGTDAVNVTVDGVPATDAGYSVIYLNSTTMQLSPAVPSGVVRLQRETDVDAPDNQFTAGAKFIASNMDENFTQIRHSQQEVRDGFEKLSDDTYAIIDTLQDVGQAAQDAADAAEQAAQTANDAAAQVNDKVSYQDLADAVDLAVTPVREYTALPFEVGKSYDLNARVMLDNGDVVKSTVSGNANNPNSNTAGWFNSDLEQREIKTYLDNFPFYIPYSPLVSDYAPQFKTALESGRPIILTENAVYPFLTKVDAVVTKGVQITGNFATLSYEGVSHIGDFISIKSSTPVKHYFYSLNVDGKHKATRVLYVEATQNNTVGLSYAYFNNCHVKRAKRSTDFVSIGGNGISVRGAFSAVDLEYSKVSDCMLGTGAGIVGSVGISGLSVTNLNATAFPHELNLTGFTVEKIYSENPDYIDDQDGIVFFGADGLIEKSVANITALTAINCWGRSIKTQCRVTNVIGGAFTRTEGNSTKVGNTEIDYQMGVGFVKGATFRYFNGYQPGAVLSMSAHSSIPRSSYTAEDCDVYLDGNTTLDCFIRTFPRTSKFGLITAKNCKIYGKAINFASLRYRGDRNIFEVQGCYVAQIVADPLLDNQLNFIAVRSSGTPPAGEATTLEVTLLNNINDGPEAYLVRDGISGASMVTKQNGRGNVGFVDSGVISGSGGQKSLVPFRATAYAGKDSNVSYSNTSSVIPAGNTVQFTLPDNTHLIGVQVRGVPLATCMVAHGSSGGILNQIGTSNVVYSTGTIEPTTQGTWLTMWRDSANSNIINIKNNNVSNRSVSLHFFTS